MVKHWGPVKLSDWPKVCSWGVAGPSMGCVGGFPCSCCTPRHIPGSSLCRSLESSEDWQPLCFVLEEFGGWSWGEEYDSCGCSCDQRDKEGVHQRGLCQRFNFLYFRTGSYLNYFIDFLFPSKSSLSPCWTACWVAIMECLDLQFPFPPPGHPDWSGTREEWRESLNSLFMVDPFKWHAVRTRHWLFSSRIKRTLDCVEYFLKCVNFTMPFWRRGRHLSSGCRSGNPVYIFGDWSAALD